MSTGRQVSFGRMSPYRDPSARRPRIAIARDWRAAHKALAFLAGAAAMAGGAGLLRALPSSRGPTSVPDVRVLMTSARPLGRVRVQGDLVPGTFVRSDTQPCEHRFALETNGFRMPVKLAACVVSDPLEAAVADLEPIPVIVEGELGVDGFSASDAFARVPSCCFCGSERRNGQRKTWRASHK